MLMIRRCHGAWRNIGTTITAKNIAVIPANVFHKRAALAHKHSNVFGVVWMFFVLSIYKYDYLVCEEFGPGIRLNSRTYCRSRMPYIKFH